MGFLSHGQSMQHDKAKPQNYGKYFLVVWQLEILQDLGSGVVWWCDKRRHSQTQGQKPGVPK